LVPRILDAAGVERVFHKIDLKPGKPLWFGVLRRQDRPTLVFGLPGNPVSGLVCFELLVRPALRALHGETDASRFPELAHARLCCDYSHRGDRVTFHPARLQTIAGALEAEPLRWHGSADLKTL